MSRTTKQKLGQKGEEKAAQYLSEHSHSILCRNYRSGHSELDIISRYNEVIVISEVKSFYADPLAAAEYRVNAAKQKNIIRGAYAFLGEYPEHQGKSVRFDVIIVDFSAYPAKITHYEGAFWEQDPYGENVSRQ